MSTIRLVLPAFAVLLFASVASAQVYYPPTTTAYNPAPLSISGCVVISADLSFGSRGGEVSKLQQFLVSQNYPGGGSWMVTGYFGQATVQAVRNFQQTAGLPTTGFVDAQTRSAIQNRTCGVSGPIGIGNVSYVPPVNYQNTPTYLPTGQAGTYPTYPTYPNTYPYTWTNIPTIGSLSIYTGVAGSIVTVYGSNFDLYNNTVRFGPSSVVASSQTGVQLTFVVPSVSAGSYQVSVSNARGVSNSMTFNVTAGATVPGCILGVGNTCCSPWSYSSACGQLSLTYLNPQSGAVGSAVTIYGTGFSPSGNTVHFGQGIIANIGSFDGQSVSFTVPMTLSGFGFGQIVIGSYPVSVTNAYGQNSNVLSYNVTSTAGTNAAPIIASVNGPTSIAAGVQGTWTITLNTFGGSYVTTSVHWGDENLYGYAAGVPVTTLLQSQQTITLTHTYSVPGTYTITFTVTGTAGSNIATATVQVGGGSTGYLSLSSLNPASGRPATQVTINGNGFSAGDNVVHFGVGGMRNVFASGGAILYTIPTYVSPCDLIQSGYVCGAPVQTVTPGTYPIYITNGAGATNILYFTVTQ